MSRTALAMPEAARGEELTPVTPAGGSGARQLDGSPCHASGCFVILREEHPRSCGCSLLLVGFICHSDKAILVLFTPCAFVVRFDQRECAVRAEEHSLRYIQSMRRCTMPTTPSCRHVKVR